MKQIVLMRKQKGSVLAKPPGTSITTLPQQGTTILNTLLNSAVGLISIHLNTLKITTVWQTSNIFNTYWTSAFWMGVLDIPLFANVWLTYTILCTLLTTAVWLASIILNTLLTTPFDWQPLLDERDRIPSLVRYKLWFLIWINILVRMSVNSNDHSLKDLYMYVIFSSLSLQMCIFIINIHILYRSHPVFPIRIGDLCKYTGPVSADILHIVSH